MSPDQATTGATASGSADGLPVETATLHHVGIHVTNDDFQPMIDWYGKTLDLKPLYQGRWDQTQMVFLINDAANHRIVLITNPALTRDPEQPLHSTLGHTAFEHETLGGLLGRYARLRDEGILPYMCIDHGMTLSIYYTDPCGFGIELQADAFGDWAKSTEYMRTNEHFRDNPVGILFDPDAVIDALKDGKSADELHYSIYDDGAFPPSPEQRDRLAVMGLPLRNEWDHPSWGDDHPTFANL